MLMILFDNSSVDILRLLVMIIKYYITYKSKND